MWVLRAGKNGMYADEILKNKRVYICWDGYDADLSKFASHAEFITLAEKEEENDTKVALRNRSSQLEYFCKSMKIGDYILIPKARSATFILVKVISDYEYIPNEMGFCHTRRVEVVVPEISSSIFPQTIKYSLGAFRNLFHVKYEDEVCKLLKENYNISIGGV